MKTKQKKQKPNYSKAPPNTLRRMGYYKDKKRNSLIKAFSWAENKLEIFLSWLESLAFLEILDLLSKIGVLIVVFTYIGTEKQRRDTEIYNSWQTITSAYDQPGNGGRIRALEFLNASPEAHWRRKFPWFCTPHPICTWPKESLEGINLSTSQTEDNASGVYLVEIQLPDAKLKEAK